MDFETSASAWRARNPARHAKGAVEGVVTLVAKHTNRGLKKRLEALQLRLADLLRDIFGNPFRPVTFAPAWRTEAAVGSR